MTAPMSWFALYLTDFADAGVMVPVCGTVAITLLLLRQRRSAFVWIAVTGSVWGLMLLLKVGGYLCETLACSISSQRLGLVSPSGHVAASAAAYGALLGLIVGSAGRSLRQSCVAAAVIATVIGVTRVMLHEHSVAEVIVGGIVGVIGAAAFSSMSEAWISPPRRMLLLGAVATSMLLFHGTHLTWESEIRAVSAGAAQSIEDSR